ncbi:MAG TPA: hypothetical protein DEF18_03910 [Muricauda sp.]|uniref:Uncharacterized protein n=1 Tax=Flagellimonas aurea TaxID=2915619 RepID=A0ABS3G5V0_9FLAO|nr:MULTISPECIES: hypothetical protein [Allomuricauda]MAO17297.1 hypothetical protein [Allomuricauda sp.]MBC71755.1 hypothetical protein [Allomuricauda sp.]MBO0354799.1 hypothetical protein [Allomuricauda aurea]NDV17053.1 hypothetical protein [Muricauda sp. TY007]HBU77224.1 hypothetical protein [Allomuricauda sp.]|tara:strand:+ start:1969 stop:2226 length:258 start_codon:yes stop_codon:yes gene_type:complete
MEKLLDRKIKIIWDFRGPTASHTAEHYLKHLKEFAEVEELKYDLEGLEHFSPTHSIAYLVVDEVELKEVRSILKPHRGQVYSGKI